jgi:uncharacterized protein YbjQ (UPF0145 family)
MKKEIIITTGFDIPNQKIKEILGIVRGNTVRSRNIGRDIIAGLKTIIGGEVKTYTQLTNTSREEAISRMIDEAKKIGADAIIAVRLETSIMHQGSSEILAYGTAVKF